LPILRKARGILLSSIGALLLSVISTASCTGTTGTELTKASLVQIIDTSLYSPPSPDPAGITYIPSFGALLISDSEVDEMEIFMGENVFVISPSGTLLNTFSTESFSSEPTGISYSAIDMRLFVSDDDKKAVFELNPGPDRILFTPDDIITSFDTAIFGSTDPEGVAFDGLTGVLYLVDGAKAEVYRISPGVNGVFDGAAPTGDDEVTHFDTAKLGVMDPEGIAFNPDTGNLIVVGEPVNRITELTTTGTVVRTIDISAAQAARPAGLTYAPGSLDPTVMNIFIVDRGVDNNSNPDENDGKLYEVSFPPLMPENQSTTIDA